jgi:hypothetical protein
LPADCLKAALQPAVESDDPVLWSAEVERCDASLLQLLLALVVLDVDNLFPAHLLSGNTP